MVRKVDIGMGRYTRVYSVDECGAGNAYHEYEVLSVQRDLYGGDVLTKVKFQKGPVKEAGVNGCTNEDLIAIVIDRLGCFQSGDYRCHENAMAKFRLEEALLWLNKRTSDRESRGVEGTSNK